DNNPLSVIESLCMGTPVLGANIGGIPELINEDQNGILFKPKSRESLEQGIIQMFSLEFDYQRISDDAKERYSSTRYINSLTGIYQQLQNKHANK
ncbi:MAG: glycosyltransferase, partial [Bacteroidales bacterium]